jgi:hypothetical protein
MIVFPLIMALAYGLLLLFFRSRGGYRPVEITPGGAKPDHNPEV